MVITIKAKKPGVWYVYRSEGLILNRAAGVVRRIMGEANSYYFYSADSHDIDTENRWIVSSQPRSWPNTIKNIIRSIEKVTD